MRYAEDPGREYELVESLETQDAAELASFLGGIGDEVPVAWWSHKDDQAHAGGWLRRGAYRLKHGSFVDPADLSCYAAQYYEAAPAGRHACAQIGIRPDAPEDAVDTPTAGQLRRAIEELCSEPALKLLQPDAAFELHGALTRGWHVGLWEAAGGADAAGSQPDDAGGTALPTDAGGPARQVLLLR